MTIKCCAKRQSCPTAITARRACERESSFYGMCLTWFLQWYWNMPSDMCNKYCTVSSISVCTNTLPRLAFLLWCCCYGFSCRHFKLVVRVNLLPPMPHGETKPHPIIPTTVASPWCGSQQQTLHCNQHNAVTARCYHSKDLDGHGQVYGPPTACSSLRHYCVVCSFPPRRALLLYIRGCISVRLQWSRRSKAS
eukprot:4776852-Amphidinium_carterae.1